MNPTDFYKLPKSFLKTVKLSIISSFLNEESIIVENTKQVIKSMKKHGFDFEIVLIDDGSTDNSYSLLKKEFANNKQVKIARNFQNFGKGWGLKTAYEFSTGNYILFLDFDLEVSQDHISNFFRIMIEENADVVIGSKLHKDSIIDYPRKRRLMSFIYYIIIKILFGLPLRDTQTPVKLFKREMLEKALPRMMVKRFAFDIELLLILFKNKARIVDAPIELNFTRIASGRLGLKTAMNMFNDTFAIFYRDKFLRFYDRPMGKNIQYKYTFVLFSDANDDYEKESLKHFLDIEYSYYNVILIGKSDFGISNKKLKFIQSNKESYINRIQEVIISNKLKCDFVVLSSLEAYPDKRFLFSSGRILSLDNVGAVGGFVIPRGDATKLERDFYSTLRSRFLNGTLGYRYKPVSSKRVAELQINGLFVDKTILITIDFDNTHNLKLEYVISRLVEMENKELIYSPDFMLYKRFPENFKQFTVKIKTDAFYRSLQRKSVFFRQHRHLAKWQFFVPFLFLLFILASIILTIAFRSLWFALPLAVYYLILIFSRLITHKLHGFRLAGILIVAQIMYGISFIRGFFKRSKS